MPLISPQKRIEILKSILCLGFMIASIAAFRVWISSRAYPLVSLLRFPPPLSPPYDRLIFAVLILLLFLLVATKKPRYLWLPFFIVLGFLILQDQNRLYPSFYEYTLFLAVIAFWYIREKSDATQTLNACRLGVISIYFYSGLSKLNPYFASGEFSVFFQPFARIFPEGMSLWLPLFAITVPFVEMGFGLGLLTKKFRTVAIIGAISMHTLIFFALAPWTANWNRGPWLWNIVAGLIVFILFAKEREASIGAILIPTTPPHAFIALLLTILPLLSFVNLWDSELSYNVYSGNYTRAVIYFPDDQKLNIEEWAFAQFGSGPYAEVWTYKAVARQVCKSLPSSEGTLIIQKRATWISARKIEIYSCADLVS